MRILIITPRIPWPLKDGGSLAMHQCIEMYQNAGYEVSLLSMNTKKHWVHQEDIPPLFFQLNHFASVKMDTDLKAMDAFTNLFGKESYNIQRFIDPQFESELAKVLKNNEFDFIQFESIYTAPYLNKCRKMSSAKMLCRVHNIEHLIWERLIESEKNRIRKKYLSLLARRLKKYEIDVLQEFDLMLCISQEEMSILKKMGINTSSHYLPFGIERIHFRTDSIAQEWDSIYHLGSMDWLPNQESVDWFLEKVWDDLVKKSPKLHFYIAGRNMPQNMFRIRQENVVVEGEIDDMKTFSLEKNILVIPLLSGAGMRIKVLEAMMLGKTIVSTALGIQGIGLTHQKNVLLAETPSEFQEHIQWCLEHKEEAKEIGAEAKAFALDHFYKKDIYKLLDSKLSAIHAEA